MASELGILRFEETYFERIWGGTRLRDVLGKPTPKDRVIGEAWLVSDHAQCESVVAEGPLAGRTLRDLMREQPDELLGTVARPTPHGRFPLLLKLLDAGAPLSVQVHPNDAQARALDEPDVGKTEMWYVLDAEPGAELICGLDPAATAEGFGAAIADGSVGDLMRTFPAPRGTGVFVPAGTVHAIGAGFLLAEIQQNSDITYRVYDWGRVDDAGKPRALHVDKALKVTTFGSDHGGAVKPVIVEDGGGKRSVEAVCPYFAAEVVRVEGLWRRETGGRSCHVLLGVEGVLEVGLGAESKALGPGEALVIPGARDGFEVCGRGSLLDYYVPEASGGRQCGG